MNVELQRQTVSYKGDPYQLPLRFVGMSGVWCLVRWPKGEGFTAADGSVKDGPFRHVRSQISGAPFFEPQYEPSRKYLRRRSFA